MNQTDEAKEIELSFRAIFVGAGLLLLLLAIEFFLLVLLGLLTPNSFSDHPRWQLPIVIFLLYFIPTISMTCAGFATAYFEDDSIYTNCFLASLVSPLILVVTIIIISDFYCDFSSLLDEPMFSGFLLLHFFAIPFGGFIYKTHFKSIGLSNQLHPEQVLEYMD